jgi:hypothetical protein
MSIHVTDQLGPFLDGELAAVERAAVAAHLRECEACARRLEEMAAVDDAARSLAVEAPEGYFNDFASRLRGKLRAPAKRRFTPPVWALAVAAALVLAVLTPLTLRQTQTAPSEPAAPLQEAAKPQAMTPVTTADQPARTEPEAKVALKDTKLEPALEKRRAPKQAETAGAFAARDIASGRMAAATPGPVLAGAPEPAAPAPLKLKEEARRDEPRPGARADAFAAAPPESLEVDAAKSKTTAPSADAESAPAQARGRASAGAGPGGLVASRNAVPGFPAEELRYRALLARGASTAADARSLREAWRTFAQSEPTGPRSDEARVRVIEAGAEAYRLSREEEDRALAERDAAAYLARSDAGQAERVRALLASLTSG